jgi:hypothetical protein
MNLQWDTHNGDKRPLHLKHDHYTLDMLLMPYFIVSVTPNAAER